VRVVKFLVGETSIELLEPLSAASPISKFLEKRGEGIHHVAFRVHDLALALAKLKKSNVPLIHRAPQPGAGGKKIAFAHPSGTLGVLMEFCEG
jgi:methylmalonyl-CoA epimerase